VFSLQFTAYVLHFSSFAKQGQARANKGRRVREKEGKRERRKKEGKKERAKIAAKKNRRGSKKNSKE
jgi:hypothetical protein